MTDREDHCLYLAAPSDSDATDPPWCGLGLTFPHHCKACDQYEPSWAPPDQYETAAWRQVRGCVAQAVPA